MLVLTYNLSPKIKEQINEIERARARLSLYPIPPKTELRHRWETILSRTYWSLTFSDNPISKSQMAKLLSSSSTKKKFSTAEKEVVNYEQAQKYILQNWLVSPRPVTPNTIKTLYDIACKPTAGGAGTNFSQKKENLRLFTEYLRQGSDHPVIQAGVAQIQLMNIGAFEKDNGKVARLIPYLYLYRFGYDFRKMVVLEEYWRKDLVGLRQAVQGSVISSNLTVWLEYFSTAVATQINAALTNVTKEKFATDLPASVFKLNNRQKGILDMLEEPGTKISNKSIQKKFKVSQITASRDLSKLVKLELLFSHGKGRSTYYTKV